MTTSTIARGGDDRTISYSRGFVLPGNETGVLLVHGFAGSIADLRYFGEYLNTTRGCTVRGVRLAGHGMTVKDFDRSTCSDWMASARQGLSRLRSSVRTVVVIGESMGALMAFRLAIEDPSVSGIVCLSPAFSVPHRTIRNIAMRVTPPAYQWRKTWVDDARAARGSLRAVTTRTYREFVRTADSIGPIVTAVTVPVLVCLSKADQIADQSSLSVLERAIPSSRLSILSIDEPVHHLNEAKDAESIAVRIASFVESVSGRAEK